MSCVYGLEEVRARWLRSDFTVYVAGGAAFFDGRDPYAVTNPRGWHYVYPPLFGLLVSPLRRLSFQDQVATWFVVSVALLLLTACECVALGRAVGGPAREGPRGVLYGLAGAAGLAVVPPVLDTLERGQLGVLITFLLILGFRLCLTKRSAVLVFAGGVVMALPISFKLMPVVPVALIALAWLAWELRARAWSGRGLAAGAGIVAGLCLFFFVVPSAVLGWTANVRHLATWVERMETSARVGSEGKNIHLVRNQSFGNAVELMNRWVPRHGALAVAAPRDPVYPDLLATPRVPNAVARPFVWTVRVALVALVFWVVWRVRPDPSSTAAVFGLGCLLPLLIAPVSWGHHFVTALPALVFVPWWLWARRRRAAGWALAAVPPLLTFAHYLVIDTNVITEPLGRYFVWTVPVLGLGMTTWYGLACVLIATTPRTPALTRPAPPLSVPSITETITESDRRGRVAGRFRQEGAMVRISVMYPSGDGKTFDHGYYSQKHMPLVRDRLGPLGLVRYEVDKGLAGGAPGAAAPYACIGQLYFNSVPEFQQAMKAHGKELMGDIPNFTNIQPQIQISEIIGAP